MQRLSAPPLSKAIIEQAGGENDDTNVADLGIVLTRGQTIVYEFQLKNPTNREVRVLGAQAAMPCCSEIAECPKSIPANGQATLVVRFRPGFRSGRKTVGFSVRSDRSGASLSTYALRADLIPEMEVVTLQGEGLSLKMGESGCQKLRIIGRRFQKVGTGAVKSVTCTTVKLAKFVGEPIEKTYENGIFETSRDVMIDIPELGEAGSKTGVLSCRWENNRTFEHATRWTVTPHLRVAPEGFVVRSPDDQIKTLIIRSETHAFRIVGIEGARESLKSGERSRIGSTANMHIVRLAFDPDRLKHSSPFDVMILTDHPDQPRVVVSVLPVPNGKGGGL